MSNQVPKQVSAFLEKELGVYPPSVIEVDREGKVLSQQILKENVDLLIQTDQHIGLYLECLEHVFPCEEDVISLPNIRISEDKTFDIHLIFEGEKGWVTLIETTSHVNHLRQILQGYNALLLRQQVEGKEESTVNFEIARRLGYSSFVFLGDGYFRIIGEPATWAKPVLSYVEINKDYIDLVELHPFLDVFLDEAQALWDGETTQEILHSGLWSEKGDDGKSYILSAIACTIAGQKLLLLGPAENSPEKVQALIQTARDKTLDMEELQKTQASLQQLIAFKNQFVSIIAHDLRAPVASVITLLRLLSNNLLPIKNNPHALSKYLQKGLVELETVLAYNQKLYDWSNLELGRFNLESKWNSLKTLLDSSAEVFRTQMKAKSISLKIDLEQTYTVNVDDVLFAQALNNLIGNAVKFTPEKGQIRLSAQNMDTYLAVVISDSGVGMEPDAVQQAFSTYFSGHRKGTSGERGSGLGLSICKKVMDAHAFKITLNSEKGAGTTVTIHIPHENVKFGSKVKQETQKKKFLKFF